MSALENFGRSEQLPECAHEREVLDLVLSERWPDRCDADSLAHVAECEICADVVSVALAMREDQALQPMEAAQVQDATLVWWRSQLRAHEEAGRKAARPIAMVQGVAIGIAGVAALSLGRTFWPWIREYGSGLSASAANVAAATSAAAVAAPWLTLAIAVSIVAMPVAVYFALGRE